MISKISLRPLFAAIVSLLLVGEISAQWSSAHLSVKREKIIPLVVGQKVLFVGGSDGVPGVGKVVDIYDDATGAWTTAQLPFPTSTWFAPSAVVIGNTAFITAAGEDDEQGLASLYDGATGTWSTLALPVSRQGATVGSIGRFLVFAGGYDSGGNNLTRVDFYDTEAKIWSTAELSEARSYAALGSLGPKLFVAGGLKTSTTGSDRVDIFDTETGLHSTATLGKARAMMTPVSVGNKLIFAGGGVLEFYTFKEVDVYDGDTDAWSVANLNQMTFFNTLQGVAAGGKAFFAGGLNPYDVVDVFDPASGTWDTLHSPAKHQLFPMVVLDDKIFFAGGVNATLGQVDILDAQTGQWLPGGTLSQPRNSIAGAVVGRKVLFAGGGMQSGDESDVVDIYTAPVSAAPEILAPEMPRVFPNPTSDQLTVACPADGTFSLFRADGGLVFSEKLVSEKPRGFSVAEFPAGMYCWKWTAECGARVSGRVFILR